MSHPAEVQSSALVPVSQAQVVPINVPQPVDKRALKSYLALIEDTEALELQNKLAAAYDRACQALIGENDVQREGGRTFKKKSAWRKLGRYFSISTQVMSRDERFLIDESTGESVFVATSTVRATAPWGQMAEAVGACATDEETGRRKITVADAIATAETRATNRATSNLIAMGEVSAEELSRGTPQEVQQEAVRELTLEDAQKYPFPWRNPAKYAGKPLGELSGKMLQTVYDATVKEISDKGETPRRMELRQACELLLVEKGVDPTSGGEKRPEPAKAAASANMEEFPGGLRQEADDLPF